jgi:hypothetical protein
MGYERGLVAPTWRETPRLHPSMSSTEALRIVELSVTITDEVSAEFLRGRAAFRGFNDVMGIPSKIGIDVVHCSIDRL